MSSARASTRIRSGCCGQGLARPAARQVDAVAGPLAEAIRLGQRRVIRVLEDPTISQPVKRSDGRCLPHAVLQLQELRGELDVGQRAPPELEVELRIVARRDALALDARLDAPDLADFVVGERAVPHEVVEQRHEPLRPTAASPATGRALIIAWRSHTSAQREKYVAIALDAARERALLALGAQVGVDVAQVGPSASVAPNAARARRERAPRRRSRRVVPS